MTQIKTQSKILTLAELAAKARELRAGGFAVVQAHGTFDLLHLGHVRHLEAARGFGDVLVVTVTADRFVNKGPGRPVFTESLRAEMLAALHFVTYVAISEAPDAIRAIDAIRPNVYAKGSDYQNPDGDLSGKITLERRAVEACGGAIRFGRIGRRPTAVRLTPSQTPRTSTVTEVPRRTPSGEKLVTTGTAPACNR